MEELFEALKRYFEEVREKGLSYVEVQYELDYLIYPYIGSFLSNGEITKEEAIELFKFCEENLKALKDRR